jgi:hypothetical protein
MTDLAAEVDLLRTQLATAETENQKLTEQHTAIGKTAVDQALRAEKALRRAEAAEAKLAAETDRADDNFHDVMKWRNRVRAAEAKLAQIREAAAEHAAELDDVHAKGGTTVGREHFFVAKVALLAAGAVGEQRPTAQLPEIRADGLPHHVQVDEAGVHSCLPDCASCTAEAERNRCGDCPLPDEPDCCRILTDARRRAGVGEQPEPTKQAATKSARKLLETALHLRMFGENAPGGAENWADWQTNVERYLR